MIAKNAIIFTMKSAHQKTLVAIFQKPVTKNLEWRKIEALFVALAADVSEGRGSRVAIVLNGQRGDFHRPHPGKEAIPYQVRDARRLLEQAGVAP